MKFAVGNAVATVFFAAAALSSTSSSSKAAEFGGAWYSKKSSIILDAYEYTEIDWSKIPKNDRLVAFINKASDGLSPKARCGSDKLCRVKWRRYAAAKELYHTRKILARTLGLKWGAYHLARPGNPIQQAEHFLQFARPDKDDLIALDIEHNDPTKWMSLADGEIFARHIKKRTGRYPVLYTNHHTSKFIADNREKYPLLSRLNLWYARYKPSIPGVFPMGNWKSYTLWQFSSMVNCNDRKCPRRIRGAGNWIDVNVAWMPPEQLRREWPFAELKAPPYVPQEEPGPLVASVSSSARVAAVKSVRPSKPVPSRPVLSKPVRAASVKGVSMAVSLVAVPKASPRGTSGILVAAVDAATPQWRPGTKIAAIARSHDEVAFEMASLRKVPALSLPYKRGRIETPIRKIAAPSAYRSVQLLDTPAGLLRVH